MTAMTHFRLLPGGGGRGLPSTRSDRLLSAFLTLALVAALLAALWGMFSGRRAVRALPPDQRAAVLSHTVEELREFCSVGRPAALEDHCRELAAFADQFDECTGACEALVRRELTPVPRR